MVSIITPSFNSEKYIEQTYQSIINQTNSNWEWLIVDDGSSDSTISLLKKYAESDNRISYFVRDRLPKGATTCRNIAVEKCRGDYLIFLDTDDILASFCLEQREGEMKRNPGYDFMAFQMLLFNEEIDDTRLLWNIEDERKDLERAIRLNPVMAGSSPLWKKDSFIKIGLWDDKILINQDIELHIRSMAYGLQYAMRLNLPPDLFVRDNQQSISRAKKKPLEKQLSRVYYYGRIADHLKKNNLLQNYIPAMRWLFMKLFLDLVYDKEPAVARQLYNVAKKEIPLKASQDIICSVLTAMGKTGKMGVAAIRFINRNLLSRSSNVNKTFGKLTYQGEIKA